MDGILIGEGRTALIYEYGQGRVLKLFKPGYGFFAEEEYEKHRIIQNAGAKAPMVYELYAEGDRKGIVYQRLTGRNMGELMLASKEDFGAMLKDMARLHMAVGRCRPDAALQSMKSRIANHIHASADLTDGKKQRLLRYLETMPDGDGLCHGDFHPENIIIEGGEATVIDWLTASKGCFAADVARTVVIVRYGVMTTNPSDEVCGLASALCDMYLEEMASIGAAAHSDVESWMPLQLAARLVEGNSEREQHALLEKLGTYDI